MKNYYIFLLFWINGVHHLPMCVAQCNEFAVYTMQNGLSGNEMHSFPVLDQKQNLWVSINSNKINVLNNGHFVKSYGRDDGLIADHVDKIVANQNGRILCLSGGKGVSIFDKQNWYSFTVTAPFAAEWQRQPALFDEQGAVYLYDTVKQVLKTPFQLPFIPKGTFLTQVLKSTEIDVLYFFVNQGNTDWIVHWQQGKLDTIKLPSKQAHWKLIEGNLVGYMPHLNQVWVLENKKWIKQTIPFTADVLQSSDNQLFIKQKINDKFSTVYEWIPTSFFKKQFTIQYSSEIKGIAKDPNGLFWVTTSSGLLKVYPNLVHYKVENYPILDELQAICGDRRHNIWFGSYSKGFSFLSALDDYSIQPVDKSIPFKRVMPSNLVLKDGRMLYSIEDKNGILATDGVQWKMYPPNMVGFYFSRLKDGRILWGTAGQGLAISEGTDANALSSKWRFFDAKKGYPFGNVLTATEDTYGRIWMGRLNHGLAVYLPQKDTILSWKVTSDPKSFGLEASVCDKNGNLWFGGLRGLHFLKNSADLDVYNLTFKDFQKISESVIGDKKVYSLQIYKDNYLIIGTEKGFGILNLTNFYLSKQPQLLFFNGENGFSPEGCEQNAIWIDSFRLGKGWIGHDSGATLADLDQMIAQFAPFSIRADSLNCNNKLNYFLKKDLDIPERGQESRIHFSSSEKDIVSFFYKIDEIGEYLYTPKPYISLPPTLNSGNHILRLVAMAVDGNISEEKVFKITIPYPFYQTWWFWFIIVSIIISGLWYWNKLTQLEIQSKSQKIQLQETEIALQESKIESQASKLQLQESEIALQESKIESQASKIQLQASELQLQESAIELQDSKIQLQEFKLQLQRLESKVIVNQLNPHFIKNSFNFLQIRLRRFKDLIGVDYASKLDKSITSVFHQSVKGKLYHTLGEELGVVKNHLDMECMRYSKPGEKLIQYQIMESKIKDLMNVRIPLFQIQIHCENAVKHGLRNNEETDGGGMIWIDFKETADYLLIYIQDNGVGRQKAIEIESTNAIHTNSGQGVKMLNQFHKLLNEKNKNTQLQIGQFYTDNIFANDENENCGTKVTIQLPKQNFSYEI
jgi:sensor histidine kinase YesM